MNRSSFIKQSLSSLLVLCLLGSSAGFAGDKKEAETKNEPPEGFIALFNGKDLSGWIGMNYHQVKKSPEAVRKMANW